MTKEKEQIRFPQTLLNPVGAFLSSQVVRLTRRRADIKQTDPFSDLDRAIENSAPDADAEEQFGHARAQAIYKELTRKLIQTKRALARVKIGKYGVCASCGNMIDTDRLMIYPEAIYCVSCEKKKERKK